MTGPYIVRVAIDFPKKLKPSELSSEGLNIAQFPGGAYTPPDLPRLHMKCTQLVGQVFHQSQEVM